jgi:putative DNA primase/helicase
MSTCEISKDYKREQAAELNDLFGFSVIPLLQDDKKACVDWAPYQTIRPSSDQINTWFESEHRNIGVITGEVSGVVVVDVDDVNGFNKYQDKYGTFPATPTVRTGKGFHYYFRHPGGKLKNVKIKGLGDFRADGGYVVAPPSFHPNGKQYKWVRPLDEVPIAEMPKWLLNMVVPRDETPKAESVVTTPYGQKWFDDVEAFAKLSTGDRNNSLNVLACKAGSLIAGNELNFNDAWGAMRKACSANGLMRDDGPNQVLATISSGIKKGKGSPRKAEDRPLGSDLARSIELDPTRFSGRLKIRKASSIKPEAINWLWDGVLAKGTLSTLAGPGGVGKSQVSLSIASIVSNGGYWPASSSKAEQGNVIILNIEDGAEYTLVPRLTACGADLERVHIIDGTEWGDKEGHFSLQEDIPKLRDAVEQIGSVSLIIIDPVTAYMGKGDPNSTGDVRAITTPLAALAQEFDCNILMITHVNKTRDSSAADKVLGSGAWTTAVRTAFSITKETDDESRRLMTPIKNNIAVDTTAFAYTVEGKQLPGGISTSYVVWEGDSMVKTADQAMLDKGDGIGKMPLALEFLQTMLAGGPVKAMDLQTEAEANGIKHRTLVRAKEELGIGSVKNKDGWCWALPKEKIDA